MWHFIFPIWSEFPTIVDRSLIMTKEFRPFPSSLHRARKSFEYRCQQSHFICVFKVSTGLPTFMCEISTDQQN